MNLFFRDKIVEPCKHEWEITDKKDGAQEATCLWCEYECEHDDQIDGFCEDCGIKMPDADEREDRAYEAWRERDL